MAIAGTFEAQRDAVIDDWKAAQVQLAYWKERESKLRVECLTLCFETPPDKGTVNYDLGGGAQLKAVFKENIKLDKTKIDETLDKIEALGAKGELIANRVIKWTPELDMREYDLMPEEMRVILDEIITVSPGSPSLQFVNPKVPK